MSPNLRRHLPLLALLACFVGAVAPTLRWPQFAGGSENLVVGTVLEMRRPGGPWLIPNLKGQPRVTKPPLTAWVTAAAARPDTIAALDDPAKRDRAYTDLAWQVRYPALAAIVLLLLATHDLARTLSSSAVESPASDAGFRPRQNTSRPQAEGSGASDSLHVSRFTFPAFPLLATAITATNLLTLRFCRAATTDVYLALFATAANAAAARAFFLPRRKPLHAALTGLFIGLGAMSKGPPVLAQTAAPLLAFAAYQWWSTRRQRASSPSSILPAPSSPPPPPTSDLHPLTSSNSSFTLHPSSFVKLSLLAAAVTLLIALPWPAYVLLRRGRGQLDYWSGEVLSGGRNADFIPDPVYAYASIFPIMLPWLPLFLWGIAAILHHTLRRPPRDPSKSGISDGESSSASFHPSSFILHPSPRPLFPLLLAFVPILVMTCFTQKNERYLLPMTAPCALVAALGYTLPTPKKFLPYRTLTLAAQWAVLFILALTPLATPFLKTADNAPWSSWPLALLTTATLLMISLSAWLLERRASSSAFSVQRLAFLPSATFLSTLLLQLLFMHGYANSPAGRSEIKPLADAVARAAPSDLPVYNYYSKTDRHKAPIDLLIYLNRVVTPTATIDPTTPQVLVLYRDPTKPPNPALIPWTKIASIPRNKGLWEAYLPPTPATSRP